MLRKIPKSTEEAWREALIKLEQPTGSFNDVVTLAVPFVSWSLKIVLVTTEEYESLIVDRVKKPHCEVVDNIRRMLFCYEDKTTTYNSGIVLSTWVKGDPLISRTRVTYDYVEFYRASFGTGYGSRQRSSCLDSVNSYRDKRFSGRVHPSPFVYDGDVAQHQYYSIRKQQYCLLQMKLETILHILTNNATFVAEAANPLVTRVTSGMATKRIATTGQSLFAFCNGLHVDSGDCLNSNKMRNLFSPFYETWMEKLLSFKHCSLPTTCGYQHVWKNSKDSELYDVNQHFVMPGLGIAVILKDSICHHFMGGSFAHCTGVCVVKSRSERFVTCRNGDVPFRIFAWGNSVNAKTYKGNVDRQNELSDHRERSRNGQNDDADDVSESHSFILTEPLDPSRKRKLEKRV